MLIDRDKRGEQVSMGYSKEKFTVPQNVYLIGTMNTADRSLVPLEVALRRRFAFVSVEPMFNEKWKSHIMSMNVSANMIHRIIQNVEEINKEIINNPQLGKGYAIGHSFFSLSEELTVDENDWYQEIMDYEIFPLLEEYFFDQQEILNSIWELVGYGN